jgi:DNA ligase (NAD+)
LLVNNNLIKNIADLYQLKQSHLSELEGLGKKSAENLISGIEKSKSQSLERLIFALGIPFVGITAARILANHFHDLDLLSQAEQSSLEALPGIGEKMAEGICHFFNNDINREVIEKLRLAGVRFKSDRKTVGELLNGKTFVLTGTLPNLTRDEASKMILSEGGRVVSSVSKSTDFVLAGEKAGSKLDKARALEITVISEDDFKMMIKK